MIESLLYLSLAKDNNNLLFPNPDDPLAPPPSVVQNIADIGTGDVYWTAYKNLCTRPNQVICGIICYIDKLATDRHGHLSLEQVYFTLSIFNQKTRNRPEAWRPLGYIPNNCLMSKAESTHAMKCLAKVQLYHDILSKIFGSLVDLQGKEGGLPYQFFYRGKVYNALLLTRYLLSLAIPKAMIVFAADTTVADQVLLACAVTAIFPAARPIMLTMSGNILYLN
jgi:hypothetical protein